MLGRGYEYATAREWALKLKELARVVADPYSAADFRHGPLALVERGYPVLAIATSGAVAADLVGLLREIREDFGADLVVVSDREDVRAIGQRSIAVPAGVPDHLVADRLDRARAAVRLPRDDRPRARPRCAPPHQQGHPHDLNAGRPATIDA